MVSCRRCRVPREVMIKRHLPHKLPVMRRPPKLSLRGSHSVRFFTPSIFLPTEEHKEIKRKARAFVKNYIEPVAESGETFNIDLFRKAGAEDVFALSTGTDATSAAITHEEFCAAYPSFCLSYMAHTVLFMHNLRTNGSEEQCNRCIPRARTAEAICGMAMSEPSCGTDVLAMKTKAEKRGDKYILNGRKMWITNGTIGGNELGDAFLVYAKTGTGDKPGSNYSLFLVEKGTTGFSLGQQIRHKCGMRTSPTAELLFDEAEVPVDNLVGEEGEAAKHMMRNLEFERLVSAAMSLGMMRRALQAMHGFIKVHDKQYYHDQFQKYIAETYAEYSAGRAYTYNLARNLDLNSSGNRIDSDGVKLFCAPACKRACDRAIQMLEWEGYCSGYGTISPRIEGFWRDSKLTEIGAGTLEAHHKNITGDLQTVEQLL
eukprot:gb/GECG01006294.1/.p1 GENE.gb/GECG01006294.1/~~gb/GECG01006294.1/.p1  ORF type:complete len:429 (+),score=47.28 gb/GECG01006294.1/:1-1287(+)